MRSRVVHLVASHLSGGGAQVAEGAIAAAGLAREAHGPAVVAQGVGKDSPLLPWYELLEVKLYFSWIGVVRKIEPS